jgi:hypothetical protein
LERCGIAVFKIPALMIADLVASHQRDGFRAQQLRAVDAALAQQHLQENKVIASGRVETAPAAPEFAPRRVRRRDGLQRLVRFALMHRDETGLLR